MKVKKLVSDRASALVELGKSDYFGVGSMPDLFHFNQTFAQSLGAAIGKAWKKALKAHQSSEGHYSQRKPLEEEWLRLDLCRRRCQNGFFGIHKAIHPFSPDGLFKKSKIIRQEIIRGLIDIEKQGRVIEKDISLKSVFKSHAQVKDIQKGVIDWQDWLNERVDNFCAQFGNHQKVTKIWLLEYAVPFAYWLNFYRRIPAKKKNKRLRKQYQLLIAAAKKKFDTCPLHLKLSQTEKQQCWNWAKEIVCSFQRSSSQVEGRNGYLAFVHRANRGMSEQRLKVLGVVHNFDIRRADGTTPANRLFKRDFPDLFEFILENVRDFPEPRKRTKKLPFSPFGPP